MSTSIAFIFAKYISHRDEYFRLLMLITRAFPLYCFVEVIFLQRESNSPILSGFLMVEPGIVIVDPSNEKLLSGQATGCRLKLSIGFIGVFDLDGEETSQILN